MDDQVVQDSNVRSTERPIVRITSADEEAPNLSFAEHHDVLDRFIDDCRNWLRNTTGFHDCEAQVVASWSGEPILIRHEMTNATLPNGAPLVITVQCRLPATWLSNERIDHADVMRSGLAACDQAIEAQKAQYKCLRISFAAYARTMSLTLAKPPVKENERQTAIALP